MANYFINLLNKLIYFYKRHLKFYYWSNYIKEFDSLRNDIIRNNKGIDYEYLKLRMKIKNSNAIKNK